MGADPAEEEEFGPYTVYERLGVGGMATVHRARERTAGGEREVALKRLLPHLAEDASFIRSFVREAKLASLLSHVNIVEIYELGRVGAEYFISMEHIDGRDVRQVLRHARRVTGPPPIAITVGLMIQLCDALDYAHHKTDDDGQPLGLVHRDVTPSNLLVTRAGVLKVIDFGIAKAESSQLRTQTGRVKGKLAYLAPEALAGGRDLDARSDVWSAGVILHELLTARPLFASKNEYQTLLRVQRGDLLPPSTYNERCPAEIDAIAFKALTRDPNQRFETAADMRDELIGVRTQYQLACGYREIAGWIERAFATEGPPEVRPTRPRSQPRNREEDEAVEMVWGTSGGGGGTPVELDDVPDVSGKHRAASEAFENQVTPISIVYERAETSEVYDQAVEVQLSGRLEPTLPPPAIDPALAVDRETPMVRPTTHPRVSRPTGPVPVATTRQTGSQAVIRPRRPSSQVATLTDAARLPSASDTHPMAAADANEADQTLIDLRPHGEGPPRVTDPTGAGLGTAPVEPVVRFSKTIPPPVRTSSPTVPPPVRPSQPSIGSGVVRRGQRVNAPLVAGGLLAVIGTTAIVWSTRSGGGAAPVPPSERPAPRTSAQVKLVTEPVDAEIWIGGRLAHAGSPWTTELTAGTYQIEIRREGYRSWLTSIELSAGENQTLQYGLSQLGANAAGEATLSITTNPAGLEAWVDGHALAARTPIKMPIKVGPHVVAVRENGVEVWRQTLTAEPASDYEFTPSLTADKVRERALRPAPPPVVSQAPLLEPPRVEAVPIQHAADGDPGLVHAAPPPPVPAVPSPPSVPVPAPVIVRPTAVTKLVGDAPDLSASGLPLVIAAKLCIDPAGAIATSDVMTKVDHTTADAIETAVKRWRYAPFQSNTGAAIPVCFVVTFKTR